MEKGPNRLERLSDGLTIKHRKSARRVWGGKQDAGWGRKRKGSRRRTEKANESKRRPGEPETNRRTETSRPPFPEEPSYWQERIEIFNLDMKTGDTLKVKGKIPSDADGFSINLGCSFSDLGLHFNPRFNESVIVCNSRCSNTWQAEHRDKHLCFSRGSTVKFIIEMLADKFQVKLPDGHQVEFPNRHCYNRISYMSVKGGFRVTSFKLE
ncbi:galectin-2 [Morphnus guianensis]